VSITILIMVILGGMGSLRGAVLGAFAIQYVNLTLLQWLGQFINPPVNALGRDLGVGFMQTFQLHSLNFLFFGIALVVMMLYRPEGLLPVASRRAELHGEGIAAEQTSATSADMAIAEETHVEDAEARAEEVARERGGPLHPDADPPPADDARRQSDADDRRDRP